MIVIRGAISEKTCPKCGYCCSVTDAGVCVGRCDIDGHTAASVEAERAEYAKEVRAK